MKKYTTGLGLVALAAAFVTANADRIDIKQGVSDFTKLFSGDTYATNVLFTKNLVQLSFTGQAKRLSDNQIKELQQFIEEQRKNPDFDRLLVKTTTQITYGQCKDNRVRRKAAERRIDQRNVNAQKSLNEMGVPSSKVSFHQTQPWSNSCTKENTDFAKAFEASKELITIYAMSNDGHPLDTPRAFDTTLKSEGYIPTLAVKF